MLPKLCVWCLSVACIFRGGPTSDPEEALAFLGKYCKWAVVTLASKGCMAKHGKQVRFKFLSNCKLHGQLTIFAANFDGDLLKNDIYLLKNDNTHFQLTHPM